MAIDDVQVAGVAGGDDAVGALIDREAERHDGAFALARRRDLAGLGLLLRLLRLAEQVRAAFRPGPWRRRCGS